MATLSYSQQRDQLVQAAQRLHQTGVMSHSGHGNMSARLPGQDLMLLTSVSHLTHLSPEQLVVITFDGEVVEGTLDPTTREIVGMHSCVYRERQEVNAVIHTHSPRTTSFALAHRPLPCVYEAFLRFGITEDIPVAEWAPRGSEEAVSYIVAQLRQHPTVPAVLLANHGLLAFSSDPLATAQIIIIMEESAQLTLDAHPLGGAQGFPAGALERERKHMQRYGSTQ
ncbi:class II aldolase/adducin family protein [Ktedonosporobacter rubrisoli]|uniref:Class II aldolase/adducin family protein n=1 Tax=Ktedonosporobacter rubrisoli TaxID=2509675 RepID=A0A4P6JM53_KTERU|nr:class II aldolase/adducin family protein [Ktedonosporobacter rubrisoli]QBD75746.1 class II aldolase/adducin family protein [Ktedonosporobacter rubrisoli]